MIKQYHKPFQSRCSPYKNTNFPVPLQFLQFSTTCQMFLVLDLFSSLLPGANHLGPFPPSQTWLAVVPPADLLDAN